MRANYIVSPDELILITGAGGFIGGKVVEVLGEYGFNNLRCFVRPSSNLQRLKRALAAGPSERAVDIVAGDLLNREDCRRAASGASLVLHLAAGVEKSFAGAFMNSALATRNLIEAFLEVGEVKRFVNVSSFAVYSNRGLARGAVLDETCPLETAAQARGDAYCFGKLKQDEIVTKYGRERGLPYVIVRPGAVFGPGKKALSGRVGIDTFGVFLHMGGSNALPLTFVDNCAEAIVLAGLRPDIDGEVFNIVDDEVVTSRELLRAYKARLGGFVSIPVPYALAATMCRLWEKYSDWSEGQLPRVFNEHRCSAEWKGNCFPNSKLHERLGWAPRVPMAEALQAFLSQFSPQRN